MLLKLKRSKCIKLAAIDIITRQAIGTFSSAPVTALLDHFAANFLARYARRRLSFGSVLQVARHELGVTARC